VIHPPLKPLHCFGQPALIGLLCLCVTLGPASTGVCRPETAELEHAAEMSTQALGNFEAILNGGTAPNPWGMRILAPASSRLPVIPPVISVLLWVRLPHAESSTTLFGLGRRGGAFLTLATDVRGWPLVALLDHKTATQICRAETGATNLCDGRLHSLTLTINMSSGLIRFYVDGKPEAASVAGLPWRLGRIDQAFAMSLAHIVAMPDSDNKVFAARVIGRELSDEEIAVMKPEEEHPSLTADGRSSGLPKLDATFVANLLETSLLEFLPSSNPPVHHRILFRPSRPQFSAR